MKAPNFSLLDQNGELHSLDLYQGKWILIYFYPKDDTPGCTKEACGFRDTTIEYQTAGIVVIGISKDGVESHNKFAMKYQLSFPLLSDTSLTTIKAYGAWGEKKFMGKTFAGVKRISVLIAPDQSIKKTYLAVDVVKHAQTVLADVESFNNRT